MEDVNLHIIDLEQENIAGSLNMLLINVPENIELIEKIRWLYIKAGHLFSYDYRIGANIDLAKKDIDFENNRINRYLTCTQISYLFKLMIEYLDPNLKVNIIERKGTQIRLDGVEHVANEVIMPTGERYILDLTLDLYLIQSGCKTKQFGFTTDASGNYDIISLAECREMDKKLGLLKEEYTDDKINRLKEQLEQEQFLSLENKLNRGLDMISSLSVKFNGAFEAKQYINKLLLELVNIPCREFNMSYSNDTGNQLSTCFHLESENDNIDMWLIYNSEMGLIRTSENRIAHMLNNGWTTRSNTLKHLQPENFKTL